MIITLMFLLALPRAQALEPFEARGIALSPKRPLSEREVKQVREVMQAHGLAPSADRPGWSWEGTRSLAWAQNACRELWRKGVAFSCELMGELSAGLTPSPAAPAAPMCHPGGLSYHLAGLAPEISTLIASLLLDRGGPSCRRPIIPIVQQLFPIPVERQPAGTEEDFLQEEEEDSALGCALEGVCKI